MSIRTKVWGLILTCIGLGILLALFLPPIGWVVFIAITLVCCGIGLLKRGC